MIRAGSITELLGRKIFFLYPPEPIQNLVVAELIQLEYEVYIITDHYILKRALQRFPDSVVFVNIDERLSEPEWELWIRELMIAPETMSSAVGVFSVNDNMELIKKYRDEIKVQCGFIVIKPDNISLILQISDMLKAADARGRRKYIRATTESETITEIIITKNDVSIAGVIKDISVVGLSCVFNTDPLLEVNELFRDIQIKIRDMAFNAESIILGSRMDGQSKIYVMLFTQRISPDTKAGIRRYTHQNLQSKMDAELRSPVHAT
jgi:hypothetical protein